jgi:hypothetical protein
MINIRNRIHFASYNITMTTKNERNGGNSSIINKISDKIPVPIGGLVPRARIRINQQAIDVHTRVVVRSDRELDRLHRPIYLFLFFCDKQPRGKKTKEKKREVGVGAYCPAGMMNFDRK